MFLVPAVALFAAAPALGEALDADPFNPTRPAGSNAGPSSSAAAAAAGDARCAPDMVRVSPRHDLQRIACVHPDTVPVLARRGWTDAGGGGTGGIPGPAAANNRLAAGLYNMSAPGGGNTVMSPAGVYAALSMLHDAAGGEAARQLRHTLGIADDHSGSLPWTGRGHPGDVVEAVDALWLAGWLGSDRDVFDAVARTYLSNPGSAPAVETVDFTGGSRDAGRAIHEWTADGTGWRIRNTFDQDGAGAYTAAVAASTIHVRAEWVTMPEGDGTMQGTFWRGPGDGVVAGFVEFRGGEFGYHEGPGGVRVIRLPYCPHLPVLTVAYAEGSGPTEEDRRLDCLSARNVSMLVALPSGGAGLRAPEAGLTAGITAGWNNGMRPAVIDRVSIPAFETVTRHDLMRPLYGMGVTGVFSEISAPDTGALGGLRVSESVHDAYVRLGWDGVEAAAVTLNGMEGPSHGGGSGPDVPAAGTAGRGGDDGRGAGGGGWELTGPRHPASGQRQPVQSFVADRPFMFVIQDDASGAILFTGRVEDPTS